MKRIKKYNNFTELQPNFEIERRDVNFLPLNMLQLGEYLF